MLILLKGDPGAGKAAAAKETGAGQKPQPRLQAAGAERMQELERDLHDLKDMDAEMDCLVSGLNGVRYPAKYNPATRKLRLLGMGGEPVMVKSLAVQELPYADGPAPQVAAQEALFKRFFSPDEIKQLNLKWITVHPHGEDEGVPILVHDNGSEYTVVGGAGGRMNQMVLQKPEGEDAGKTARKLAKKEQRQEQARRMAEENPEEYQRLENMAEELKGQEKEKLQALDDFVTQALGTKKDNVETFVRKQAELEAKKANPQATPDEVQEFADQAAKEAQGEIAKAKDQVVQSILDQRADQLLNGADPHGEVTVEVLGRKIKAKFNADEMQQVAEHLASIAETRAQKNAIKRALNTGKWETIQGIEAAISKGAPTPAEVKEWEEKRYLTRRSVKANVRLVQEASQCSEQMQRRSQANGASDSLNAVVGSTVGHAILGPELCRDLGVENAARVAAAYLREQGVDTAAKGKEIGDAIEQENYASVTSALKNAAEMKALSQQAKKAVANRMHVDLGEGAEKTHARQVAKALGLSDKQWTVRTAKNGSAQLTVIGDQAIQKAKAGGYSGTHESAVVAMSQARIVAANMAGTRARMLNTARGSMRSAAALAHYLEHDPGKQMSIAAGATRTEAHARAKRMGLDHGDYIVKKGKGGYDLVVAGDKITKFAKPRPVKEAERATQMDELKSQLDSDWDAEGHECYKSPNQGDRVRLKKHQVLAVRAITQFKRMILNYGAGSGKTFAYHAALDELFSGGHLDGAIMTMPAKPRSQQRGPNGEVERLLDGSQVHDRYVVIEDGRRLKKALEAYKNGDKQKVFIMSPQMMRDNIDLLKAAGFGGAKTGFFADEAHEFAIRSTEKGSDMAKAARELAGSEYCVLGSGTLIENDASELHSLVDMVQPGALGDKKKFQAEWQRLAGQGGGMFVHEKMGAMRDRVSPYMVSYHQPVRRTDAATGEETGDVVRHEHKVVPIDLDDEQRGHLQKIVQWYEGEMASGDKERRKGAALERDRRINKVLFGPTLAKAVVRDIMKEHAASGGQDRSLIWSEHIGPGSPMAVFKKEMAAHLEKELGKKFGQAFTSITGDDDAKATREACRRVNDLTNETIGAVISNAANYGMNLQGAAMVNMLGFPMVPSKQGQLIARALRHGQTRDVIKSRNYIAKHLTHQLAQFRTQRVKKAEVDLLALLADQPTGGVGNPVHKSLAGSDPDDAAANRAGDGPSGGADADPDAQAQVKTLPDGEKRRKLERTLAALLSDESGCGRVIAQHWGTILAVARGEETDDDALAGDGAAGDGAGGAAGGNPPAGGERQPAAARVSPGRAGG